MIFYLWPCLCHTALQPPQYIKRMHGKPEVHEAQDICPKNKFLTSDQHMVVYWRTNNSAHKTLQFKLQLTASLPQLKLRNTLSHIFVLIWTVINVQILLEIQCPSSNALGEQFTSCLPQLLQLWHQSEEKYLFLLDSSCRVWLLSAVMLLKANLHWGRARSNPVLLRRVILRSCTARHSTPERNKTNKESCAATPGNFFV